MNLKIAGTARNIGQSCAFCNISTTKTVVRRLTGSLLLVSALIALGFFCAALAAPKQSSPAEPVSDDTLLVRLAPHTDRSKAQSDLLKEAQATTIRDMHVDREDYSILLLQPAKGQSESTFDKIQAMMKTHPEILSVTRNYVAKSPLPKTRSSYNPSGADGNQRSNDNH